MSSNFFPLLIGALFITDDMHAQLLSTVKESGSVGKTTDADTAIMKRLTMFIKMLSNLSKWRARRCDIRLTNVQMRIKVNNANTRQRICSIGSIGNICRL